MRRYVCKSCIWTMLLAGGMQVQPTMLSAQNPALDIPNVTLELPEYVSTLLSDDDRELFTRLLNINVEAAWGFLRNEGHTMNFISDIRPVHPDMRFVGRARTGRYLPNRPDMRDQYKGPQLNAQTAVDTKPGDVLVFDMGGHLESSPSGDVSCLAAMVNGCAGVVVEGVMRDVPAFINMGLPLFTRDGRGHTAAGSSEVMSWDYQIPVRVGDVTVAPGDYLVGVAHGVLVIPPSMVEKTLEFAEKKSVQEFFQRKLLMEGESVIGVYPPSKETLKRLEEWKKSQPH
jgi:5-oxopent-3-ene-1,2,5-tricarboxylate decarboxylase / 2-hydroxyhepta-2,4-diene-1,7-dioate isomerase